MSPKMPRKERSPRGARNRKSRSPVVPTRHQQGLRDQEAARLGMSPSTAECLRAVFAANLWHQGLVHDAMACASFLKFHPNLPKQHDHVLFIGGHRNGKSREEKVRQRHSVEISSSFLLAQYSSDLAVALEESTAAASGSDRPPESSSSSSPAAAAVAAAASGSSSSTGTTLTPTLSLLADVWEKLS